MPPFGAPSGSCCAGAWRLEYACLRRRPGALSGPAARYDRGSTCGLLPRAPIVNAACHRRCLCPSLAAPLPLAARPDHASHGFSSVTSRLVTGCDGRRTPTRHSDASSRSSRRNGQPLPVGLRPRSMARCLPPLPCLRPLMGSPSNRSQPAGRRNGVHRRAQVASSTKSCARRRGARESCTLCQGFP